ncbi:DUF1615 domain-containing protein [Pseudomarimonas salicorniae]|uniref:DUF1615 domain-containing protein n=1 Tax=Pseudomarimonas salicorniae TaxID=2933270 RepID=A0ABT0GFP3_9GAMM|nr:DUF1615 domain-containing protein [Lysobacter sp. CAU 1642]MCK7593356.1 DUF1615 domain-containing protein [Lysobacter sp. CAU 1642]
MRRPCRFLVACAVLLGLAACSTPPERRWPERTPAEVREQLIGLLPAKGVDREGWATDIEAAFRHLALLPSTDNLCAALAVIEQETGYRANPEVPGLPRIARQEIERRAARLKIPPVAVAAVLELPSGNGQRFEQRVAALRTEKDMSDLFEELIGRVPLGQALFASANPVRTGGSMQVSIEFAARHAAEHGYPYGAGLSIRDEVFTRRGGVYFGIAHLLQYPNSYDRHIYRYADFNAGWYASRNAAFQKALSLLSGQALAPDGDLRLPDQGLFDSRTARTEQVAISLAPQLGLPEWRVRRDLALENRFEFEQSETWRAVFAAADARAGKPLPRAVLPQIVLEGPKISRRLTTAWFANRVQSRYQQCINRAYAP